MECIHLHGLYAKKDETSDCVTCYFRGFLSELYELYGREQWCQKQELQRAVCFKLLGLLDDLVSESLPCDNPHRDVWKNMSFTQAYVANRFLWDIILAKKKSSSH